MSITGFIKQYISVEPGVQIRLVGYPGEQFTRKVTITSHEEQPLEIREITSTLEDTIDYELTTIEKNKKYSLELTTPLGIQESFRGKILLETNSQKKPNIELNISSIMQQEVKVAPQYVYFGIIDTTNATIDRQRFKRKVSVSRAKGGMVTIEKIESNQNLLKTEIETTTQGEKQSIVLTLLTDNLQKGDLRETVTIHTKYNTTSEIVKVIVEAKVK